MAKRDYYEVLGVGRSADEKELKGKDKMRKVFQKWINAADALIEMIILKLPSSSAFVPELG
jgi:hypothetical protein